MVEPKKAAGTRKSMQTFVAPSKIEKLLITNKVTVSVVLSLSLVGNYLQTQQETQHEEIRENIEKTELV